ncbi:retrotransposon protein, putative, ty3-gypsy subclass [Tanacetum coccineum]
MTSGREITPPLGFSAVPITTIMFAAATPENIPMAYRASTSANPNPMISPTFVEANYEALKSLLRDQRRQMRNNDLQTELEYFSEDYDEEREMEPRHEPTRAATPPLRVASPKIRGRGERTIKDYPLPDGLKMPSHISSYDGKGDPDNFLHLFERAIWMQKWLMPVEHLSTDLPSTYKGLMEKTYTWVEAREVATNGASSHLRDSFERLKKSSWDNNRGQKNKDRFSPYRGPNHGLLPSLSKSPKEILAMEKAAGSFEPPPKMFGIPLEITIGDAPSRTETLNFIIVRSDSSHNMLLGSTAMQRMGIVVSTIHKAIKFHTKKGIETVLSADKTDEGTKKARKILAANEERVLSCVNAKEKIIVYDKYPNQTVTIGKQLPEHFKKELQNLLKSNAYVFAWTHADMTGITRTIMVKGKPFNTEHKLNEYSHVKPIKQNKRGLGLDRNMAACKETKELTKAGILWKVKHQTWVANPVMLNPKKSSFSVEEGPFLGHLITKQGIKANPSKVKAVTDLDQPRTLKDIQSLNRKLAALSRFLSKGAERSLAFFKVLKGCKDKKSIQWTTEADKALEKMKKLVQALPTLTAPRVGETLTMHLAASKESISVMLAAKRNEGWTPIYFVSRVLQGAELNYHAL